MGPILLGFVASNHYLAGGNSGEKVKLIKSLIPYKFRCGIAPIRAITWLFYWAISV